MVGAEDVQATLTGGGSSRRLRWRMGELPWQAIQGERHRGRKSSGTLDTAAWTGCSTASDATSEGKLGTTMA